MFEFQTLIETISKFGEKSASPQRAVQWRSGTNFPEGARLLRLCRLFFFQGRRNVPMARGKTQMGPLFSRRMARDGLFYFTPQKCRKLLASGTRFWDNCGRRPWKFSFLAFSEGPEGFFRRAFWMRAWRGRFLHPLFLRLQFFQIFKVFLLYKYITLSNLID